MKARPAWEVAFSSMAMNLKREKNQITRELHSMHSKAGCFIICSSDLPDCCVLQSSGLTDKPVKYWVTWMPVCAESSFFIPFAMPLDPEFSVLFDSVSRTYKTELHLSESSPWLLLKQLLCFNLQLRFPYIRITWMFKGLWLKPENSSTYQPDM